MKTFFDQEAQCELSFKNAGECYHLWTPENFSVIFACEQDFQIGMGILGLCAKLFPDIVILTFELMSNHLHVTAAGEFYRILLFLKRVKTMLQAFVKGTGRVLNWDDFDFKYRKINSLSDIRNVIVYNNRNGYVVCPDNTPFTYPWGANRYYFNPDAKRLASQNSKVMTYRQKRTISHSRKADDIEGLYEFDDYALPLSFCDIEKGESFFRNASHYFFLLSKNIEANRTIAKEIGESMFYNDDELFSVIQKKCLKMYDIATPSLAPYETKIELARFMRYEYNANKKQITRILRIDPSILDSLNL